MRHTFTVTIVSAELDEDYPETNYKEFLVSVERANNMKLSDYARRKGRLVDWTDDSGAKKRAGKKNSNSMAFDVTLYCGTDGRYGKKEYIATLQSYRKSQSQFVDELSTFEIDMARFANDDLPLDSNVTLSALSKDKRRKSTGSSGGPTLVIRVSMTVEEAPARRGSRHMSISAPPRTLVNKRLDRADTLPDRMPSGEVKVEPADEAIKLSNMSSQDDSQLKTNSTLGQALAPAEGDAEPLVPETKESPSISNQTEEKPTDPNPASKGTVGLRQSRSESVPPEFGSSGGDDDTAGSGGGWPSNTAEQLSGRASPRGRSMPPSPASADIVRVEAVESLRASPLESGSVVAVPLMAAPMTPDMADDHAAPNSNTSTSRSASVDSDRDGQRTCGVIFGGSASVVAEPVEARRASRVRPPIPEKLSWTIKDLQPLVRYDDDDEIDYLEIIREFEAAEQAFLHGGSDDSPSTFPGTGDFQSQTNRYAMKMAQDQQSRQVHQRSRSTSSDRAAAEEPDVDNSPVSIRLSRSESVPPEFGSSGPVSSSGSGRNGLRRQGSVGPRSKKEKKGKPKQKEPWTMRSISKIMEGSMMSIKILGLDIEDDNLEKLEKTFYLKVGITSESERFPTPPVTVETDYRFLDAWTSDFRHYGYADATKRDPYLYLSFELYEIGWLWDEKVGHGIYKFDTRKTYNTGKDIREEVGLYNIATGRDLRIKVKTHVRVTLDDDAPPVTIEAVPKT